VDECKPLLVSRYLALLPAIKAAVTIPVMAKARIGHFVEAQILESVGRGSHSAPYQLNLSSSAHRVTQLNS